jgi:hypothetical protein
MHHMRRTAVRPAAAMAVRRTLCRCCRGVIAVPTAIVLVALLGFVSLAVDIGSMLWQRRAMQSAADSAALGAALAATVGNPPDFTVEGKSIAASYGFVDGTANTSVKVSKPPTLGAYASNAAGVEVLITRPYSAIFASLFHPAAFWIAARAVALVGPPGSTCVLALDPAASGAFLAAGSPTVTLNGCDIDIQSNSASALTLNGSAVLNVDDISIVGGYQTNGSTVINASEGIQTNAKPVIDPYRTLAIPAFSGCNQTNFSVSGSTTKTLSPGVYCNGISISNSAKVTLNPGQYILDGGNFSVSGSATVTGSGVTIILTSSSQDDTQIGEVAISDTGQLSLSAMTTGSTAGLVFYQDQDAPTSGSSDFQGQQQGQNTGTNTFQGSSSMQITGAIYFPQQAVSFSGSSGISSGCTQIFALTIQFAGSSTVALNCTGIPIRPIGATSPSTLVE